jgi:hypothetical protein
MGLERGSLNLMSTIEELLERKSNGYGLESREYGRRDPSLWPRGTFYPQKLALTSPTCGCRSVDIVRSRTQATEFLVGYGRCILTTELNFILPPVFNNYKPSLIQINLLLRGHQV